MASHRWRRPATLCAAAALVLGYPQTTMAAGTPGVSPQHVALLLHPGDSQTITKTVTTPQILPKPDVYFLADTTGSMGSAIDTVRTNAATILSQVDAAASDPQYGAGQYKDFPYDPFAFQNDQSITASKPAVQAAISTWSAGGGSDLPEANLYALHKLITAAGFRAGSSRIVVWFGDAPGHDPVCAGISGESSDVAEASVTAELVAAGVKVIAVSVASSGAAVDGLNGDPTVGASDYGSCAPGGTAGQANRIAAATGGQSFTDVPPADVANKIIEGLTALPVTVKPSATCDPGLSVSFAPAQQTVTSGTDAVFQETITVAANAPAGVGTCTVDFLLNDLPAGADFTQTNTITVNRPPDCSKAAVSPKELWPPNHKLQTVTASVPDPDGDAVATTITAVTQDEALNVAADGNTTPDAAWVAGHPNQVQVRAERSGQGDGRVYRVLVTATDGKETCTGGKALVSVPHDRSGQLAVDTTSVVVNSFG